MHVLPYIIKDLERKKALALKSMGKKLSLQQKGVFFAHLIM
jgi:hypothetical protein